MVTVQLSDDLAKHLQDIARRENQSIDAVVEAMVRDKVSGQPTAEIEPSTEEISALDALMGMFDDDVTDMSSKDEEILREYYKNKLCRPD